MADLSVKYAGMEFKNPLIMASGPTTDGVEMVKAASDAGFGGIVLKSMGYRKWAETSKMKGVPRYQIVSRLDYSKPWDPKSGKDNRGLIVQGESISVWGADQYGAFINECKETAASDVKIGASALCSKDDITSFDEGVKIVNESRADFIEIDIGYPRFYDDPGFTYELMKRIRERTSLPLTLKMPPFLTNPTRIVKGFQDAGVDGVVMYDIYLSLDIDIEKQAPLFRGTIPTVMMPEGFTLPYTLQSAADVRLANLDISLSTSFGVWYWQDVVKCILAGADTVQICRKVMVSGFKVARKWLRSLNQWLDRKGFDTLYELKGKVLENSIPMPKIPKEKAVELGGIPSLVAFVAREVCDGCGFCEEVCFYFAMKTEEMIAQVEPRKCTACGLCLGTCPSHAIRLVERKGS
jgi:dihydroorotate dehydrogenase/NAD-dependent dihydropyrimidine dehydrogenase PreA subunit